jgi:hypothetical protein
MLFVTHALLHLPWLLLQDMLSVTGVCQHWRDVGTSLFFTGSNWRGQPDIRHPAQLVTLVSLLITLQGSSCSGNPS